MDRKGYNKMLKSVQNVADNPFIKVDERLAYAGAYALFRFCKTSPTCGSKNCPLKDLLGCNSATCTAPQNWGNNKEV